MNMLEIYSFKIYKFIKTTGARGKEQPPFLNNQFAYLFLITFLYYFIFFFIIYLVRIHIHKSYVNKNLHVSTLCILLLSTNNRLHTVDPCKKFY